jgi:multicomponent Na+:H+ antiporter subunit D
MLVAGLALGGLPAGFLARGSDMIVASAQPPAAQVVAAVSAALTGAALLRAAGRIFLGWSGVPGVERAAPTEREQEKPDRPLLLMLFPCFALIVLAFVPARLVEPFAAGAAAQLGNSPVPGAVFLQSPHVSPSSAAQCLIAPALALASLLLRRPTTSPGRTICRTLERPLRFAQSLHSGIVGDYVAWMAVGLALIAALLAGAG